jgi:hypothetical protein
LRSLYQPARGAQNRGRRRGDIRQNHRQLQAHKKGDSQEKTHKDCVNLIKNATNKQEFSKINVTFDFLEPPSYQALAPNRPRFGGSDVHF